MWPHEIANGKWLLYPMRVELEGGQGPGKKGICSPRPNILRLVRLRQGRPGGGWEGCRAAGVGVCVGVAAEMPSRGLQYLKELSLRLPGCGQQG